MTTIVRSGGIISHTRSAVARSSDRVSGPSASNCFGRALRDKGQNRVPAPPAMITAYAFASSMLTLAFWSAYDEKHRQGRQI